jgi:hypothetical protein
MRVSVKWQSSFLLIKSLEGEYVDPVRDGLTNGATIVRGGQRSARLLSDPPSLGHPLSPVQISILSVTPCFLSHAA